MKILEYLTWCIYIYIHTHTHTYIYVCVCVCVCVWYPGIDLNWKVQEGGKYSPPNIILAKNFLLLK